MPLIFTDSAASKVKDLVDEEGNPDLKLRVFVQGGGCSGFQYGFTFDELVNDDDTQMTKNGVTLLIDAMSLQYLAGAEIDYKDDLQGAQFVIKNPNATTTCGCGSSFSAWGSGPDDEKPPRGGFCFGLSRMSACKRTRTRNRRTSHSGRFSASFDDARASKRMHSPRPVRRSPALSSIEPRLEADASRWLIKSLVARRPPQSADRALRR